MKKCSEFCVLFLSWIEIDLWASPQFLWDCSAGVRCKLLLTQTPWALMGPLVWKMQNQRGARSRTGWINHVIPGPRGHSFCSRVNFTVKIYQLHLLLHTEQFILQTAFFFLFFPFFYFSGIILDIPAGYMQKVERKQYICFWKLMVLCHGTDFLKQNQISI